MIFDYWGKRKLTEFALLQRAYSICMRRNGLNFRTGVRQMKKHSVFALVSIIILLAASPSAAEILYYITDLGSGTANAINNNGQVVGSSGAEAILFDTSGQGNSTNLGGGAALSINGSGQIVGRSGQNVTLFDPTGGLQNIILGDGIACSINGNGQIVGVSGPGFPGTGPKAKIFNTHTDLGGYWSAAYSNNDNGQIVGYATSIYRHSTLFDPTGQGNNTDLGTLTGYNGSEAHAINDYGDIVGFAGNYDEFGWCEEYTAVLFDETGGGSNINLGTLDGFSY